MSRSSQPLVSVVVPTYNRCEYIVETLESVLSQTYRHLELVIVDDGSTDGTKNVVLERFKNDSRLHYFDQSNSERAVARNSGIREARGEYVAFLDSDDIWLPHKLELQVSALQADGAPECCYCLHDVFSADRTDFESHSLPPEGDIFEPLLSHCFIGSMTPVIHRKCFDIVGGFCEDHRLLCFEDWEMWTRLASTFQWKLVPEVLGRHRLHAGNTQHAADWRVDDLRLKLMGKYRLAPRQRAALRDYSFGRRWHWATHLYRSQPRSSLALLTRLARTEPRRALNKNFWGLAVRALFNLQSQSVVKEVST